MRLVGRRLKFEQFGERGKNSRRADVQLLRNRERVELGQAFHDGEIAFAEAGFNPRLAVNVPSDVRVGVAEFVRECDDREVFDAQPERPGKQRVRHPKDFHSRTFAVAKAIDAEDVLVDLLQLLENLFGDGESFKGFGDFDGLFERRFTALDRWRKLQPAFKFIPIRDQQAEAVNDAAQLWKREDEPPMQEVVFQKPQIVE